MESLEKNHEIVMKALNDIQKNIKYPSAVASVPAIELQTFPSLPLPAAGAQNSFADRQQTPKIGQVHAIRERLLSTASNMSGNGTKRKRDEAKIADPQSQQIDETEIYETLYEIEKILSDCVYHDVILGGD